MSHRETIIVATLVNAVILSTLFFLAVYIEEGALEGNAEVKEALATVEVAKPNPIRMSPIKEEKVRDVLDEAIEVAVATSLKEEEKREFKPAKVEKPKEEATKVYTVQSGDNPWTIAKKFHVGFEEIVRLNNLDDAKARNLRPGDKLLVPNRSSS